MTPRGGEVFGMSSIALSGNKKVALGSPPHRGGGVEGERRPGGNATNTLLAAVEAAQRQLAAVLPMRDIGCLRSEVGGACFAACVMGSGGAMLPHSALWWADARNEAWELSVHTGVPQAPGPSTFSVQSPPLLVPSTCSLTISWIFHFCPFIFQPGKKTVHIGFWLLLTTKL